MIPAIGALDRRLMLQAPVETPDGMGGVVRDHDTLAVIWGSVTPLAGRSDTEAGRAGARLMFRIVIRFRHDVTTRHRLRIRQWQKTISRRR